MRRSANCSPYAAASLGSGHEPRLIIILPKKLRHNQPTLTATEVAEFMFCAKAWQLKREGHEPDSPQLEAGIAFHRQHGKQLTFASKLQRAGWVLVGLALLLLVLLLWNLR